MTKETQRQVPRFQLCPLSASLFREVASCAIDALTEDKINNSSKKKKKYYLIIIVLVGHLPAIDNRQIGWHCQFVSK